MNYTRRSKCLWDLHSQVNVKCCQSPPHVIIELKCLQWTSSSGVKSHSLDELRLQVWGWWGNVTEISVPLPVPLHGNLEGISFDDTSHIDWLGSLSNDVSVLSLGYEKGPTGTVTGLYHSCDLVPIKTGHVLPKYPLETSSLRTVGTVLKQSHCYNKRQEGWFRRKTGGNSNNLDVT